MPTVRHSVFKDTVLIPRQEDKLNATIGIVDVLTTEHAFVFSDLVVVHRGLRSERQISFPRVHRSLAFSRSEPSYR